MNLHDATLLTITVDWAEGTASVRLHPYSGMVTIEASGLSHLDIPRRHPWGPSVSVNEVTLVDRTLRVEMQSGDTLVIEADEVVMP
jgi:hypothetical protein